MLGIFPIESTRPKEADMSKPAKSILVFGVYMAATGLGFLVIPNILLDLFGFPTTDEPWIRVVGLLVLILAFYYIQAARQEVEAVFRWSLYCRPAAFVVFTSFVLLGLAKPMLILFGVIDLLGAIWTGLALRSADAREPGYRPGQPIVVDEPERRGSS
jgi:hypothetical protein